MIRRTVKYMIGAAVIGSVVGLSLAFLLVMPSSNLVPQPQPKHGIIEPPPKPLPAFPVTINQWDTYTNSKYGFSFKYPAPWSLSVKEDEILGFDFSSSHPSLKFTFLTDLKDENNQPRWGGFSINIDQNPKNLPLEKWIRDKLDDKDGLLQLAKPTVIIGNAKEALVISDDNAYLKKHTEKSRTSRAYFIGSNTTVFSFNWFYQAFTYDMRAIEPQILSSFVFSK